MPQAYLAWRERSAGNTGVLAGHFFLQHAGRMFSLSAVTAEFHSVDGVKTVSLFILMSENRMLFSLHEAVPEISNLGTSSQECGKNQSTFPGSGGNAPQRGIGGSWSIGGGIHP